MMRTKMNNIKIRKNLIMILLVGILFPIGAKNFRGPVLDAVVIKEIQDYSKQVSLSVGELLPLQLDSSGELLEGILVEISLTERLKRYSDSFGLMLYYNVNPVPVKNILDYSGKTLFSEVFPLMNKISLYIPLKRGTGEAFRGIGKYVASPVTPGGFPLVLTVEFVMKGVPDSVLRLPFRLKISPVLKKVGFLTPLIIKPEEKSDEKIEFYIDDSPYDPEETPIALESGLHTLLVISEAFKEESRSFSIETGETTEVEIALEVEKPEVKIDALPGTLIFIDGNKIDEISEEGIDLAEGEHAFLFKIGDYSVSRNIYIKNGKKYNFSLFFEIDVKEY